MRISDWSSDVCSSDLQIDAFGTNSLFLFWRDSSGTPMAEKSVHDDAPSAARIHAFFENAVEPILSDNAALPVAVGALMAALAGPALLPDRSGHRGLPHRRTIMRETTDALTPSRPGKAR